jgi:hypothetical protein
VARGCVINKPSGRGGHSPRWAAEPEKIIKKLGLKYQFQLIFTKSITNEKHVSINKMFITFPKFFGSSSRVCQGKNEKKSVLFSNISADNFLRASY